MHRGELVFNACLGYFASKDIKIVYATVIEFQEVNLTLKLLIEISGRGDDILVIKYLYKYTYLVLFFTLAKLLDVNNKCLIKEVLASEALQFLSVMMYQVNTYTRYNKAFTQDKICSKLFLILDTILEMNDVKNNTCNLYYKSKSHFLEVLVPHLLKDMSNILTFSDFYRNMLLVSKHNIWCENETYLRVSIIVTLSNRPRLTSEYLSRIDDESIIIVDVLYELENYSVQCSLIFTASFIANTCIRTLTQIPYSVFQFPGCR
ncbi:hypothetical protein AGLY_008585 [Aphis glycines]|uniref:Uncharacterized protein n=1 Tax=Aphis glycines TaxID=307491 RepID=A0A6G0TKF7_APHGL|nr:hypothetical protein AGLY_008585 [Aphis glycines]